MYSTVRVCPPPYHGKPKFWPGLGGVVDLARRLVVAHAVHLVVGEPEGLVLRIEVHPDRIADAVRVDLAVAAVAIHADDAAKAPLVVEIVLFGSVDVIGLPERDVELVVRPDAADAGRMVEAFLRGRDQFALLHDRRHCDVRTLVEELGGREGQYPVLLDGEQKAVLREADAVRIAELDRRRELPHVLGNAHVATIRQRVDLGLAGADIGDDPLRVPPRSCARRAPGHRG